MGYGARIPMLLLPFFGCLMSQIVQSFTVSANTYGRVFRNDLFSPLQIHSLAQAFTTTDSFTIIGVALKLFQTADYPAHTISVSIKATAGGLPTGSNLASATVNVKGIAINIGRWYQITFDSSYVLSATTTYAIVVSAITANGGISWPGRSDDIPVGEHGAAIKSPFTGSSWRNVTDFPFVDDFNFITLIEPAGDVTKATPQDNDVVSTGGVTTLSWNDPGSGATKYLWVLTWEDPIWGPSSVSGTRTAPTTEIDVSSSILYIYNTGARECTWMVRPYIGGEYVADDDPWTLEIVGPPPVAINPTPADTASSVAMAPLLTWELDGPLGDDDYFFIYLDTDITKMSTADGFQQGWIVTPRLQVLSGLVVNTTYYWQVHVSNTQGWSESAIWSFTTRNFAPPVVSGGEDAPTGENNMLTVRRLIAAARNRIYYENI